MDEQDRDRRQPASARATPATSLEPLDELPVGALRMLVHELRLHQIELEMQNEELRLTQAALDATREHYFNLYDMAPVAYCTVDARSVIQQVNLFAARLLGTEREALVDLPLTRFIASEDQDHFYLLCRQLVALGEPRSCEMRFVNRAGERFWVELDAAITVDDHGEHMLRIVFTDITVRRQAAQLREKQEAAEAERRAMSRFLSAASHDLRQPTHAMGLLIEQLKQLPGTPQNHVLVSRLDASVRTLEHMLNALLDLSRLDPDCVQVRPTAVPFARVLEQLRHLFPAEGLRSGVRLKFRPSPAWLSTDPALLQRVLHNLVGNALRFTSRGTVLVCCRPTRDGAHARIEVRDSGIGIHADHLHAIFDEFFQADNPERDRAKGLGLGLSIVKRTCALLGHPIEVRSAPGQGSCFTVTLPLAPVQPAIAEEVSQEALNLTQEPLVDLRVLVIEDDPMACDALFDLLKSWQSVPYAAEGIEAARALVAQGVVPDLIVSDYRLRGTDNGIDAVLALRQLAGRELPACLITGDTDRTVAERARHAGMALLYKPARPAALRELLLSMLPTQR